MNTKKKNLIISIVLHLMLCNTHGQISTKEMPVSFGIQNLSAKSVLPAANKILPALNMAAIQQEDANDEANGFAMRTATGVVNMNLTTNVAMFIYPNPASNELNVEIKTENLILFKKYSVTLYGFDGQRLFSGETSGENIQFNTSKLANVAYFIHLADKASGEILQKQTVLIKR